MEEKLIQQMKNFGNTRELARMLGMNNTRLWRILNFGGMLVSEYEMIMNQSYAFFNKKSEYGITEKQKRRKNE